MKSMLAKLALLFYHETTKQTCFALIIIILFSVLTLLNCLLHFWFSPGGFAWRKYKLSSSSSPKLKGPSGWPLLGSLPQMGSLAHRKLATMAASLGTTRLMALSLGTTPVIISSHPETAKEILCSPSFSDRPIKASARLLMFERAIGFAPHGTYWRHIRRVAVTYMFSPKRISGLEGVRQCLATEMMENVLKEMQERGGVVELRGVLQEASLRNMLESVFGRSNLPGVGDHELGLLVREGYELISEFNLEDYFPFGFLDFSGVKRRCHKLACRVNEVIGQIIQVRKKEVGLGIIRNDFLTALLSLPLEEQPSDSDTVALLWETIFRGADTVATLLEWIMARITLHQDVQEKAQDELDKAIGNHKQVQDSDIQNLPYLQAIVKEVLRLHPPGPLLSWARLAIHDVQVDKVTIPAGTTAMVNMWAITHDPSIWTNPLAFNPDRFIEEDVSIMGTDLRLAPFGSGRWMCPGKPLGLATVHLWLARMLQQFKWLPAQSVDLSECLRLSLEMKKPLACFVAPRAMKPI